MNAKFFNVLADVIVAIYAMAGLAATVFFGWEASETLVQALVFWALIRTTTSVKR